MRAGSILSKACWILINQGPVELWKRAWRFVRKYSFKRLWLYRFETSAYKAWLKKEEIKIERILSAASKDIAGFGYLPLISLIIPVWNNQAECLDKAIKSVCAQVYPYWELCIANDASMVPHVETIIAKYRELEPRIKVVDLPHQTGLVRAGNCALRLATGDYTGFLDHDGELAPHALLEIARVLNQDQGIDIIYTDEDRSNGGTRSKPFFKPDWSPDLLMSMNYIGHLLVVKKSLLERAGGFREGIDGSQEHDLILRLSELTPNIVHIPQVLYHWQVTPGSVSNQEENRLRAIEAGKKAVEDAINRRGLGGIVTVMENGHYRVKYQVKGEPLISIIIPTKDRVDLLSRCLESIIKKSTYHNFEIIVVDNGSADVKTLDYFYEISNRMENCFVFPFSGPFNFSRINNFAARKAKGDFLLFLNNDTEVITSDWLEEMLSHVQRPGIGAVGVKLLFPDDRIQHAGVILGIGGVAGHAFYSMPLGSPGYMEFATVTRNCMAVTAACLMMSKKLFEEVGGFDEELDVAYNDIDLCLRVVEKGHYIVWTPHTILYHYESASRGQALTEHNIQYFCRKWQFLIKNGDPFYNRNLTLSHYDYRINIGL